MTDKRRVHKKLSSKQIIGKIVVGIIGIITCLLMIFPFYYMVTSSFKTMEEYLNPIPTIIPHSISFDGYKAIFSKINIFGKFFLNSLLVSLVIPLIQIIVCLPASYALARLKFKGRNLIFILFISSMMIPGQLTIIQNYVTMSKLNLINNLGSLILLGIFSPLCIFTMRQFLMTLPKELEEAGKIDGCSTFQNFLYIVAPLSIPIISVNLILCFNGVWGDFFTPMIMLKSQASMTLPVGLTVIMGALKTQDPTVLMAALTISCVPVTIIFFIFRKRLMAGIASTGLKM